MMRFSQIGSGLMLAIAMLLMIPAEAERRYYPHRLAVLILVLSVSLAGMIGWIGLLVPHIARLIFGLQNSRLLPASTLIGGCFFADCLSRTLSTVEIPVGIVTECLGLPIFLQVLWRVKKGWG